jgi:hemerythrin
MDIHDLLTAEHDAFRAAILKIRALRSSPAADLETLLEALKNSVRRHFLREEVYYRPIDKDARFSNPDLVHHLRNDHAAVLFGMESLLIRLRKKGPALDWWTHFDKLMDVFGPHMKQEEESLFPEAARFLTPAEWEALRRNMKLP